MNLGMVGLKEETWRWWAGTQRKVGRSGRWVAHDPRTPDCQWNDGSYISAYNQLKIQRGIGHKQTEGVTLVQFVLQEIDLPLEFGRDGVHDSLENLRIKSLELHTVLVINGS